MSQKGSHLSVLLLIPLSVGIVTLIIMGRQAHIFDDEPAQRLRSAEGLRASQMLHAQQQVTAQEHAAHSDSAQHTQQSEKQSMQSVPGVSEARQAVGKTKGQGLVGLQVSSKQASASQQAGAQVQQQAASPSTPETAPTSTSAAATGSQQQEPASSQPTASSVYNETQRRHPNILPGVPILPDSDPGPHCALAKGSWCGPYWTQAPVASRAPPRGNKECPGNCNGLGYCDHDTGKCVCRAGYAGADCLRPQKRACFNMDPLTKRDANYTGGYWIHSRCAGICDDDIGMCYCPPETKFGRKVDPKSKKVVQEGRPLYWCQPNTTADGTPVTWTWNTMTYDDVYGPMGWCNSEKPKKTCDCRLDGVHGRLCEQRAEQVCMNQCTGHGECMLGFCMCHPGWYGHDCSRKKAGEPMEEGDEVEKKPWLKPAMRQVPAAQDPQKRPHRKRPFIYVYDMDPAYHSHILQYRIDAWHCNNRMFFHDNGSGFIPYYAYAVETAFHELMLTSEHRTFDPEEADYFYVPLYTSCMADNMGKASKPFWPEHLDGEGRWDKRPQIMSMMTLAAQQWLAQAYPYWNRTGGADHIFLSSHDEGPCYVPIQIWDSVIISHWGRTDFPHGSNSSYYADNYSEDLPDSGLGEGGWLNITSRAHACHDPEKHLVVPVFKQPISYIESPYVGTKPKQRDILALFRGDIGLNREGCKYSRCIRQTLYKLAQKHGWAEKHKILIGGGSEIPGDYSDLLSRSKFCLVIPGDGWSARYEDATTNGCVPVIIMDNTLGPFESQIDYSKFSIRIAEHDIHKLVDILLAVTPERLEELQAGLAQAWMRFRWNGLPLAEEEIFLMMKQKAQDHGGTFPANIPGLQWAQTGDDDAFSTVIQWLYHRIPHTRGNRKRSSKLRHRQR